jgi:hypothetical protein
MNRLTLILVAVFIVLLAVGGWVVDAIRKPAHAARSLHSL